MSAIPHGKEFESMKQIPAAQILMGQLQNPFTLQTKKADKELSGWDMRAMWSYMRLQHGRKIDKEIKDYMETVRKAAGVEELSFPQRQQAMAEFFNERVSQAKASRTIQFILYGSYVKAVASLNHLLIPPETVYRTATKLIHQNFDVNAQLREEARIFGRVWYLEEELGLHYGLQFHAGDITTRLAIKVCGFVKVLQCTNPVSWLGIGGFRGFVNQPKFERVLRIEGKSDMAVELEQRLAQAIENARAELKHVKETTQQTQKIPLNLKTFKPISAAMSLSYGLGADLIEQLWEQFKSEPQSIYGAAMATSWLAKHGEYREMPEGRLDARGQKLSTISGAFLLIKDPKDAEKKSLHWLKAHVKQGEIKTLDQLLKGVV